MLDQPPDNDPESPSNHPDDSRCLLAAAYDACAPSLFRYAAMLLADPSAAEDVVHQVFAKLAALGRRLAHIHALTPYLRRAVRNECYRLLQHQSRLHTAHAPDLLQLASPDQPQSCQELRPALEQALRSLPPEQREVVHMKIYEKMTFRQIAHDLAISSNTAASRYRYALLRLRELLAPYAKEQP
jgi:RNA polymerase sigma-70 factor (ECF subfamily)